MRASERISNFVKKLIYPFFYFGQWDQKIAIYKINKSVKFKVRVNTIDKPIVWEIWKMNAYTDSDFKINPPDVVVDIGAHIGAFSIYAAKKAIEGEVYAYEPNKENYDLLLKNKILNNLKNLYLFNLAISDKKGTFDLFIGKSHNAMDSLYKTDSKNKGKVSTITSKDILIKNKLKKIDFLKMDAEGAEYDIILSTAPEILKKIEKIVIEYHDYLNINHNHKEIKKYLEKNGFKVSVHGFFLQRKLLKEGIIKAKRNNN